MPKICVFLLKIIITLLTPTYNILSKVVRYTFIYLYILTIIEYMFYNCAIATEIVCVQKGELWVLKGAIHTDDNEQEITAIKKEIAEIISTIPNVNALNYLLTIIKDVAEEVA